MDAAPASRLATRIKISTHPPLKLSPDRPASTEVQSTDVRSACTEGGGQFPRRPISGSEVKNLTFGERKKRTGNQFLSQICNQKPERIIRIFTLEIAFFRGQFPGWDNFLGGVEGTKRVTGGLNDKKRRKVWKFAESINATTIRKGSQ